MTLAAPGKSRDADRELCRRMALSYFDFEETRLFLDRLEPTTADNGAEQDNAIRTALMTALLVSYWRPFAVGRSDGQTAQRLPKELLEGLSREQLQLHEKVGTLRDKQFAHTDPEPAELAVTWNLRDQGFRFSMLTSNVTRIGLTSAELSEFRALHAEVSRRVFVHYAAFGERLLQDPNQ